MDKKLEDALRTSVRRSLQEMSRALNGDKRLEVAPLFIVSLHLDDTKRIELRPTVQVRAKVDLTETRLHNQVLLQPGVHYKPAHSEQQ